MGIRMCCTRAFPDMQHRVQKTQITFFQRHAFAYVSFAKVKRKAKRPQAYIVLTLLLPVPYHSERVAIKIELCPGRWMYHILLSRREEIDEEVMQWIREACGFTHRRYSCSDGIPLHSCHGICGE